MEASVSHVKQFLYLATDELAVTLSLEKLGRLVIEKRGENGLRETAKLIGISPATLSRIERGHLPDLETFSKVCQWLKVDPGRFLGMKGEAEKPRDAKKPEVSVHFRKKNTVPLETAQALAKLIFAAQEAVLTRRETDF